MFVKIYYNRVRVKVFIELDLVKWVLYGLFYSFLVGEVEVNLD